MVRRIGLLFALALAGCGSESGGSDMTPCEADQQTVEAENTAPCCSQEPLTAADCPEGTTFSTFTDEEHDLSGEQCLTAEGDGTGIVRQATLGGATVFRGSAGNGLDIHCDASTGRQVVRYDNGCVEACYDGGRLVPRAECPGIVSDRAPSCPGYE